jgi:hypothetical protein
MKGCEEMKEYVKILTLLFWSAAIITFIGLLILYFVNFGPVYIWFNSIDLGNLLFAFGLGSMITVLIVRLYLDRKYKTSKVV